MYHFITAGTVTLPDRNTGMRRYGTGKIDFLKGTRLD